MKEGGPETFVIDPYDKKNIKVQKEDKMPSTAPLK
jgi:hypothetical protein